ncbi:hypothetical protein IL306_014592 [Fusarium sp. DS 682]|nr:hypothetical protein IL306_014592 [Fusarium sp. DS 682]
MWDKKAVFDDCQVLLASVTVAHSAAVHFKHPEGRERNTTPFIWLLATLIFLWTAEWIYFAIWFDKMTHDGSTLLVATPHVFVLVLQLNAIIALPSEKGAGKKMAWHAYPVSWFLMILLNTLVVVKNVQEFQPKTPLNYARCLAIPIVRYCLLFALFAAFTRPDRGGHIKLGNDLDSGLGLDKNNESETTVRDEIREAGGLWPWAMKYKIFGDLILPRDMPWMWLDIPMVFVLILFLVTSINVLISLRANERLMPLYDQSNTANKATKRQAQNAIQGWATVAAGNQINYEIESHNERLDTQLYLDWTREKLFTLLSFVANFSTEVGRFLAWALVAPYLIRNGGKTGSLLVFDKYWDNITGPLAFFASVPQKVAHNLTAAHQLRVLLEIRPTITYGSDELQPATGDIEFQDVSFSYLDPKSGKAKPIFRNFSITFEEGKTTAILGESGAGKTTILELIANFHHVAQGSVKFGGQDIRTLKRGE